MAQGYDMSRVYELGLRVMSQGWVYDMSRVYELGLRGMSQGWGYEVGLGFISQGL